MGNAIVTPGLVTPGTFCVPADGEPRRKHLGLYSCARACCHIRSPVESPLAERLFCFMRMPCCLSLAISLLLVGCGEQSSPPAPATNANTSGSSPLNAPADYVGALGKAQQTAVKTVDTTSLNQAIQMFNVDKGRYPKDLNELVTEKYIPKLPAAPFGMKLDYDAASGQVKVVKQ